MRLTILDQYDHPLRFDEQESDMSQDQVIITRLRIKQFRGLETLDVVVPPSGVLFQGTNGIGKTSALRAINALLEGEGVGPDAIRLDADRAELLVDFEKAERAMVARRSISRESGTTIKLENADGTAVPRAKEQLRQLFGDRPLDPLKLYNADPKTRRQMILAACPVKVTAEQLNAWCETTQQWNTDGHGYEVLARVRQMYFDRRTKAGQDLDETKAKARLAEQAAAQLRVDKPETMTPEAARTHVAAAEREIAVLHDRRAQAEQREQAAAGQRAKVAELRAKAEALVAQPEAIGPNDAEIDEARAEEAKARLALEQAEDALRKAKAAHTGKAEVLAVLRSHRDRADKLLTEAETAAAQATELEQALAINTLDGDGDPIALQAAAAEEALEAARALVARAEASAKWRAAQAEAEQAHASAETARATWEALERIVQRLTKTAPAELASAANAIPGLEVTPTSIKLDGKDIDMLSGAEKLRFCVALAKRVVTGAKILTVDELGTLAPAALRDFVAEVIKDGWQLFGTRPTDGELDIVDCYQLAQKAA